MSLRVKVNFKGHLSIKRKLMGAFNVESFYQRIATNYEKLSSNEQMVIDLIIRSEDISKIKIKNISKELFISSSTIVRAARKLGYATFSELKYSALQDQDIRSQGETHEPLEDVLQRINYDFSKTVQMLSRESISKFVSYLNNARRIFCVGSGSSVNVSSDFTKRLKLLDYWINDYDEIFAIRDIADIAGKDDVIVVFSLAGGNDLVNNYLVRARANGTKIISITGMLASSVIELSDANVLVYASPTPRARMRSRLMLYVASDVIFEYVLSHPKGKKLP